MKKDYDDTVTLLAITLFALALPVTGICMMIYAGIKWLFF